ncbi:alpha/beta hydrolase [Duganella sp. BJB1802]|uniref:alpha/beta fold hydrolase n=1 Tax=Duganella sp. BJB1802 TaxID=2744575 RepID=UPI0015937BEF|nr:alpha/beta hydrolase [Duganella sp. BJB1802]NVD71756.1 alpha/beta hydrolase [Duganella sp. BJB1802]
MTAFTQSLVETNGIRLQVAEQGKGPLVLLLHGFPETSYSWRYQLKALSAAGYRALAPDLRGYGRSECPSDASLYTTLHVVSDLVGLLNSIGERQAVVVGNDWGANIAWQAAQVRPDRFRAVVALGVPLMGRAPMLPSRLFPQNEQAWFYTHYFAQPNLAKAELEEDIATTLKKIYFSASGDVGERNENSPNPFGMVSKQHGYLASLPEPDQLPNWLSTKDLDVFVQAFKQSGFQGGLNYYRNLDTNWDLQGAFEGMQVSVPALYMVGGRDTGLAMPGMKEIIAGMSQLASNLRGSHVIPHAGHWLQQEAADQVSARMIEFLRTL